MNRRFTFFLVGLVGLVLAVGQFRLGSFVVPAVYLHLADLVPGLSAVRVPGQLDTLFHLSICVLAGYGAAFLVRGRWQNLIGAALIALTFSELTVPAIAKTVYGYGEGIRTFAYGPPEGHTEYLRKQAGNDAVLDLPATNGFMRAFVNNPHYVALQAFHHKPVVACRNSFPSPIGKRMDHIFEPWTKHSAIKLAALGIHYVVLHKHAVPLWTRKRPDSLFRLLPFDSALHRVFMDKNADVYRITVSKSTTTTDTGKLSLSLSSEHICETPSTISKVHLIVRNTGTNLWRHPDNIRPLIVAASWKNIGGRPEGVSEVGPTGEIPSMRTAGPLVLLPKEAATIKLGIPLPVNRGHYEAELTVSGMIRPAQRLSLDAQVLEDRSLCATP